MSKRTRGDMGEGYMETVSAPKLTLVLDAEGIHKAIRRIAHELIERHESLEGLVVAGIPTRGVEVARRIIEEVRAVEGVELELGVIDISMHRDDLATRNRMTAVATTHLPVDLDGRTVVLVDDVFYTGRSVRAALDALASYGRPGRIELAVLIDRGHRELPIAADYVGKQVVTRPAEKVRVRFENLDAEPDSVRVSDYSEAGGLEDGGL